jgi:hypothetical protein
VAPLHDREIVHIRFGYGFDGLRSVSPVKLAAQQIGAGIAMEKFMNEFWRNGALPTLVLQTEKTFGDDGERARKLANRFLRTYRNRRRGVVVLEDGVTAKPLNWSHVDAQFMEQKRELVETIARVWRVPMSKLMSQVSGSSMTYRNLEQERHELYGDAVLPKVIRIESALRADADLFPSRLSLFPKFNADEVLRADSLTRAKVNAIRTGGAAWVEADEVRAEENLPPSERLMEKQLAAPRRRRRSSGRAPIGPKRDHLPPGGAPRGIDRARPRRDAVRAGAGRARRVRAAERAGHARHLRRPQQQRLPPRPRRSEAVARAARRRRPRAPDGLPAQGPLAADRDRQVGRVGRLEAGHRATGRVSDVTAGRDAATLLEDGAIDGISIGFRPVYREDRETVQVLAPGPDRQVADAVRALRVHRLRLDGRVLRDRRVRSVDRSRAGRRRRARGVADAVDARARREGDARPAVRRRWDDVAYSMALLMGGRGAGAFTDLPTLQRLALYQQLAAGYEQHGKTPPAYDAAPDYSAIEFQHDERHVFADRFLRKSAATLTATARGIQGPLSQETREVVDQAQAAIGALEPQTSGLADELRQAAADAASTTRLLKETETP